MGSTTVEETPLKSNSAIQREKQIATLNDDRMNVPVRKSIYLHLKLLLIGLLQALCLYFIYQVYYNDGQQGWITRRDLITSRMKTFGIKHSTSSVVIVSLIYLGLCIGCYYVSNIKKHLDNVKNVKELKNCYSKIRNSGVSLIFNIECYHKVRTGKKNQTKKVITHTAQKIVQFSECYDLSGFLKPQIEKEFKCPYVFVDYKAKYEFLQAEQEQVLKQMYDNFVVQNKRDEYQDHKQTFKFSDCKQSTEQGYLLNGDNNPLNVLLFLSSLVLLAWPVALYLEWNSVQRYEVTILKKVKLAEAQVRKVTPPSWDIVAESSPLETELLERFVKEQDIHEE